MRIPVVTRWLLLVNLGVFVLDWLLQRGGVDLAQWLGLWYIGYAPLFQPWQLVTYMFMHGGFEHIFFNMFALWMFGRVMEQCWGGKRFLIYYLVCGVGAGLVQELGQVMGWIQPYAMTVGASGAVYGVLLAFGVTFPEERIFIIPIPFPIKVKYFVGFYALVELFLGVRGADGVAHFAHLGGMLFGLLLILHWRRQQTKTWGGRGWGRWTTTGSSWGRGSRYGDAYDRYDRGDGSESLWTRLKRSLSGEERTKHRARAHMHVEEDTTRSRTYTPPPRPREEREAIDRILEKVRKGGYGSLTDEEKARLFNASGDRH